MRSLTSPWLYAAFIAAAILFIVLERLTHFEFLYHLAAIPIEVMVAVFIVERALEKRESREKRRQLMFIKSHLFRSEMRDLFLADFAALKSPALTMAGIRAASLEELRKMRRAADTVEYKGPEEMETVIMEYVRAERIWRSFMERAIAFNFEEVFQTMISILHFISDVRIYKEHNPDRLFIEEALKDPRMKRRTLDVIGDGIRRFLEYALELKEKQPAMFEEVMGDYALSERLRSTGRPADPASV